MTDYENNFRSAILEAGMVPPVQLVADGGIHRFSTSNRPSDDAGWYVLNLQDGHAWGAFGDWRTGSLTPWSSHSLSAMSPSERQILERRISDVRRQAEEKRSEAQTAARVSALSRYESAIPVAGHPYLSAKSVHAHGLRAEGEALLVPLRDVEGELHSIQTISPTGDKRFLVGGRVSGCMHLIGQIDGTLVICEGYATGASIHAATGLAVAVSFNAGNLQAVATALRTKHPTVKLILAADDDWQTEGNPGLAQATAAAAVVHGYLATPCFSSNRGVKDTDFNDMVRCEGLDAVRARFLDTSLQPGTDDSDPNFWPEPIRILPELTAEEYPIGALPGKLRAAVEEVVQHVKAPVPLVVTSAFAALSVAIQGLYGVERAGNLFGPTSLFLLAVAESGERKSTCDSLFVRSIRDFESSEAAKGQPLLKRHRAEMAAWEAKRDALLDKIKQLYKAGKDAQQCESDLAALEILEPQLPQIGRLIYTDVTPEALAHSLATKWPSGGVISSEAGIVFGGAGMSKDSALRNLSLLNQLWDGTPVHVDRRSSDSFTVRNARLTVGLQVQPGPLLAFLARDQGMARATGFLARFLVSWPESTQGTRTYTDPPARWPALESFHDRITQLLCQPVKRDPQGGLAPAMLQLSPEAKSVWVDFFNAVEREQSKGGDLRDFNDVASKAADNAARIAALLHVFEGLSGAIGKDAMTSAVLIMKWHLKEAKRLLGAMALSTDTSDVQEMDQWLVAFARKAGVTAVPLGDILQYGPGRFRRKAAAMSVLAGLQTMSRLRVKINGKSTVVHLHPSLLKA